MIAVERYTEPNTSSEGSGQEDIGELTPEEVKADLNRKRDQVHQFVWRCSECSHLINHPFLEVIPILTWTDQPEHMPALKCRKCKATPSNFDHVEWRIEEPIATRDEVTELQRWSDRIP